MIARHKINPEYARQRYEDELSNFEALLQRARGEAAALPLLITKCMEVAEFGSVVDPVSPEIVRALRLAAQAHTALFAVSSSGGKKVSVPLGKGRRVTYTDSLHESTVHTGRWIEGFYVSTLCRDKTSLSLLCDTPTPLLKRSTTKGPEYRSIMVDALRAVWKDTPEKQDLLLEAMTATDPDRPDVAPVSDWVLFIDIHIIRLFFYLTDADERFGQALSLAAEDHKKYWSKASHKSNPAGFLSIPLLGVAALAYDAGLRFDVESDYIPGWLIRQTAITSF